MLSMMEKMAHGRHSAMNLLYEGLENSNSRSCTVINRLSFVWRCPRSGSWVMSDVFEEQTTLHPVQSTLAAVHRADVMSLAVEEMPSRCLPLSCACWLDHLGRISLRLLRFHGAGYWTGTYDRSSQMTFIQLHHLGPAAAPSSTRMGPSWHDGRVWQDGLRGWGVPAQIICEVRR
ncbi:hypothetical protein PAXRUDRAFT_414015 [Paxillus rubicundulus Ve08.2h10]|uniref:Uncharacterized protein n=1 Tax=Paxillus rubicundulus Ve08.2h10 TaxID=930991 RepID=A0A0D0DMF0_9AGAM|nr:hypothetical protein PAXRUDRAFT_414015 [Paxillus rubicundulus Ve08.2h10]